MKITNIILNLFKMNVCIKYENIIYYDRIDVAEGIDVNKTSTSKECDVCHYWYSLNYSFESQPNVLQ